MEEEDPVIEEQRRDPPSVTIPALVFVPPPPLETAPKQDVPPNMVPMPSVPQKRKPSCLACMASKVKCNRELPCSRCVRLRIACCPNPRLPGRPLKRQTNPATGETILAPPVPPRKRANTQLTRLPMDGAPRPPHAAHQFMVLGFDPTAPPSGLAPSYILSFIRLLFSGKIQMQRTRQMLRAWHAWNLHQGRDGMQGNLAAMCFILNIDMQELVPLPFPIATPTPGVPEKVEGGPSEADGSAAATLGSEPTQDGEQGEGDGGEDGEAEAAGDGTSPATGLHSLAAVAARMNDTDAPAQDAAATENGDGAMDLGGDADKMPDLLPPPEVPPELQMLRQLLSGDQPGVVEQTANCAVFWLDGRLETLCNEKFSLMFLTKEVVEDAVTKDAKRLEFLIEPLVTPEYKAAYFDGLVESSFSSTEQGGPIGISVKLLRVMDRWGQPVTVTAHFSVFVSPDGRFSAVTLRFIPIGLEARTVSSTPAPPPILPQALLPVPSPLPSPTPPAAEQSPGGSQPWNLPNMDL